MLGSVQDAEGVVQETMLATWRGLSGFEERSSVRTWLYQIATNRCLNALRASGRRPVPVESRPSWAPKPTRRGEPSSLPSDPDSLLDDVPDLVARPEGQYEARETIAIAFVAAVQRLPLRQWAVLVLRDLLGFRSAEVAEMPSVSEASVNSALPRARATMARSLPRRDRAPLPRSAREREVAARFATAFAGGDVDGVVALLTEDGWRAAALAARGEVAALVASRRGTRAVSSAGERFPDTEEVTGSNPVRPTRSSP
jgi:RNA polymerase sigma-70 factor (TIGR02960 family)